LVLEIRGLKVNFYQNKQIKNAFKLKKKYERFLYFSLYFPPTKRDRFNVGAMRSTDPTCLHLFIVFLI